MSGDENISEPRGLRPWKCVQLESKICKRKIKSFKQIRSLENF